jgi:hypothetical protein
MERIVSILPVRLNCRINLVITTRDTLVFDVRALTLQRIEGALAPPAAGNPSAGLGVVIAFAPTATFGHMAHRKRKRTASSGAGANNTFK